MVDVSRRSFVSLVLCSGVCVLLALPISVRRSDVGVQLTSLAAPSLPVNDGEAYRCVAVRVSECVYPHAIVKNL